MQRAVRWEEQRQQEQWWEEAPQLEQALAEQVWGTVVGDSAV